MLRESWCWLKTVCFSGHLSTVPISTWVVLNFKSNGYNGHKWQCTVWIEREVWEKRCRWWYHKIHQDEVSQEWVESPIFPPKTRIWNSNNWYATENQSGIVYCLSRKECEEVIFSLLCRIFHDFSAIFLRKFRWDRSCKAMAYRVVSITAVSRRMKENNHIISGVKVKLKSSWRLLLSVWVSISRVSIYNHIYNAIIITQISLIYQQNK